MPIRWDEQTNIDLMIAMYNEFQSTLCKEIQDSVVEAMRCKGHDVGSWDVLR